MRKKVFVLILCLLFTLFVIIGNSFLICNSFKYITKNIFVNIILFIITLILFYNIINYLFNKLDNKKLIKIKKLDFLKKTKIYEIFKKHPFITSFIIIIICWIPYIISFYPTILSPDPSFQIKQYFNIPNKYSNYVVMIDPNQLITNHHPVIHTLLLGTCVKIGTIINNVNLGLFIYSIIQILVLASTLAYTIKFLNDIKLSKKYLLLSLIIYSFVPIFPFYAMSAVKDVIFGSLIILYIIRIYKFIKCESIKLREIITTILLLILIVLFRNNGIHVILLSFPFLIFIVKAIKNKLKIIFIFFILLTFNYSYNNLILPYFKITQTSVREMLSIPFQQTARYVKTYNNEVTDKEKKAIDKILNYDTLASRYKVDISDPVKNEFNRYYKKEELNEYFRVWFKQFTKHPITYIEATINNTYGYFYPAKTRWFIYYKYYDIITEDGFDYHYNKLSLSRKILSNFGKSFPYIPFIGLIVNIAFNVWILIFMFTYLFYRKKYKELVYLIPSFVLVLVCIASPVNAYFRYALPFVFALMLNLGIFIKEGVLNER